MRKLARFTAPIAVAGALGPLAAGVAVCLFAIGSNLLEGAGTPLADLLPIFAVYILFAYISGGVTALLGGLLLAIWMLWRPASVISAVAAAIIAVAGYSAIAMTGLLGPVELTSATNNFALTLTLGVVVAVGCWFLVRLFVKPPYGPI